MEFILQILINFINIKKMESRFKCTGWYRIKYINPFTLNNDTMIKYIFININEWIVQYPGCLNRIINYVHYLVGILLIYWKIINVISNILDFIYCFIIFF